MHKIVKFSRIMDFWREPASCWVVFFVLFVYLLLCDIRRELLTGGDLVLSTKYK